MSQLDTLDLHMLRVRGHDDAADQMRRDSIFIEQLRADVALLRHALAALQDATSHIPGHHGPDVWRVVESARQALERTCRDQSPR